MVKVWELKQFSSVRDTQKTVSQLMRICLRRNEFYPRPVHVGLEVDKVALDRL